VTSKAYRRVALYEPGEYVATLSYYNGTKTVANWIVRPLQQQKKAKNVILFIGKKPRPSTVDDIILTMEFQVTV
jgi:hypothetical protein